MNLVGNAIKFTSDGEVGVTVNVASENDEGFKLHFEVTDTGIGITEEQIRILFQPFSQADVSTNRRFEGSGLGLTICNELTELMGGNIGVRSEFGEGSTFFFDIFVERSSLKVVTSSAVTIISLFVGLLVSLGVGYAVSSSIARRIETVSSNLQDIAEGEGDLTVRLDESGGDEFSELSRWFNVFVEQLRSTISEISTVATDLNAGQHSAAVFSGVAGRVSDGSAALKKRSASIATNSGEMASEISSVAAAVEESTTNVRDLARANDAMSKSLGTISENGTAVASGMSEIDRPKSRPMSLNSLASQKIRARRPTT